MTLLRSIVITIIVSLGFAFGLKNLLGFWETFSLAVVIQFIVSFLYNSKKINKVQELTADFENELEQLLSLSEAKIPCPCGNYTHTTNLFYNIDETYICEECTNEFRVEFSATPTLLTQPVYTEQDFNNLKEEKVDDVEITSDYQPGTEL